MEAHKLQRARRRGRVHRAGPLLADGTAVGSLLVVDADDLDALDDVNALFGDPTPDQPKLLDIKYLIMGYVTSNAPGALKYFGIKGSLVEYATKATQEMLLDSFMLGLLFTLVQQKWHDHSRYWWAAKVLMHLLYNGSLVVLASPSVVLDHTAASNSVRLISPSPSRSWGAIVMIHPAS